MIVLNQRTHIGRPIQFGSLLLMFLIRYDSLLQFWRQLVCVDGVRLSCVLWDDGYAMQSGRECSRTSRRNDQLTVPSANDTCCQNALNLLTHGIVSDIVTRRLVVEQMR